MIRVTDKQFWIDPILKSNLDSVVYNATQDWDFVIPVTGSGMTRVGKSMLAFQVAYYLAEKLETKFNHENVVFTGQELMDKALVAPKHSVFIYDESRGDLDSKKSLKKVNANLYDFFAECGMLNHIIILVMPDFFELQKGIAVNRSIFLLNVKVGRAMRQHKGQKVVKFERGKYEFYNTKKKRMLYFIGKKNYNDYSAVAGNFTGDFREMWVIDKEKYEAKKLEFMRRNKEEGEATDSHLQQRNGLMYHLVTELKYKFTGISNVLDKFNMKITPQAVGEQVRKFEESHSPRKTAVESGKLLFNPRAKETTPPKLN